MVEENDGIQPDSFSEFDNRTLRQLLVARQSLTSTMGKISHLASVLSKSEMQMQHIAERLSSLQAVMAPLLAQAEAARGVKKRIDEALGSAASVLKTFKEIHGLQRFLSDDPKADVGRYLSIVCRLEKMLQYLKGNCGTTLNWVEDAMAFLIQSRSTDQYRLHRLTDTLEALKELQMDPELSALDGGILNKALDKLMVEFKRLLKEISEPIDLVPFVSHEDDSPLESQRTPPRDVVVKLQSISQRLTVNGYAHKCLNSYKEVRVWVVKKSLQTFGASYLKQLTSDEIDKLDWEDAQGYINQWLQQLRVAVNVLFHTERHLCKQVFEGMDHSSWVKCFGEIVQEGNMSAFFQFGEAVVRSEKKAMKLFKFLDLFEELELLKKDVGEIFEGDGCMEVRLRFRELQKQVIHIAFNSFVEFRREAETRNISPPQNGGNARLSSYVVNYLKYLIGEHSSTMEEVLRIETSWKEGRLHRINLSIAVVQVMNLLERSIEEQSRTYRDPALTYLFLMNNYWYMFNRSMNSELAPYLDEGWIKECRRRVDQNALKYNREAWEGVLQHLRRENVHLSSGGRGGSRDLLKQRIKAFNTDFEEVYNKNCKWSIPDPELRSGTQLTVVQLLVPAYRSFIHSYGSALEGSGAHRLIKYSPDTLERLLGDLFLDRPGSLLSGTYVPDEFSSF